MPFRWECDDCRQEHTKDFAEGVTCAKREKRVPDSLKRPDISLYREDDLCHLIEVVVYHKPEPSVHEYARERDVSLVVVDMKEGLDLHGTVKARVVEGSVCPNMPVGSPVAPLDEVKGYQELKEHPDLKGYVDLMATEYGNFMGFIDLVDGDLEGEPVRLKEGTHAIGVLERIRWLPGGQWVHVYLRYLEDPRFLLPVAIPDKCEDLRDEAALIGKVVLLHCIVVGVNFVTGNPRRRYRIRPLRRTLRRQR